MSDQPTGEQISERAARERFHGRSITILSEPKPTGEWTAETVHQFTTLCLSFHDRQNIADAHNAALAAEQTKHRNIISERDLREQLAAERKLRDEAEEGEWTVERVKAMMLNWYGENDGYRIVAEKHNAALAAEKQREEFDWGHVKREYLRLQKENQQLRKQLHAEREKRMEEGAEFSNISARAIQLQENMQTLVDALKFYAEDRGYGSIHERAQVALAKVGK